VNANYQERLARARAGKEGEAEDPFGNDIAEEYDTFDDRRILVPAGGTMRSLYIGADLAQQVRIGLYKIFFYFWSFVHDSIVLSFSRPACITHTVAIPLHDYRAIYTSPARPPCCIPYTIHYWLITIMCKSQSEDHIQSRE